VGFVAFSLSGIVPPAIDASTASPTVVGFVTFMATVWFSGIVGAVV